MSGFFVCGFHVAFYGVHLPALRGRHGLDASVGVWALTLVGMANLVGTYIGRAVRPASSRSAWG